MSRFSRRQALAFGAPAGSVRRVPLAGGAPIFGKLLGGDAEIGNRCVEALELRRLLDRRELGEQRLNAGILGELTRQDDVATEALALEPRRLVGGCPIVVKPVVEGHGDATPDVQSDANGDRLLAGGRVERLEIGLQLNGAAERVRRIGEGAHDGVADS